MAYKEASKKKVKRDGKTIWVDEKVPTKTIHILPDIYFFVIDQREDDDVCVTRLAEVNFAACRSGGVFVIIRERTSMSRRPIQFSP